MEELTIKYRCKVCVNNSRKDDTPYICCKVMKAGNDEIITCKDGVLECSEYREESE